MSRAVSAAPTDGPGRGRPAPPAARLSLPRRAVAEAFGTGLLVAAVVGYGIMGERLAGGNVGLALLANTAATGAMLLALIMTLGPRRSGPAQLFSEVVATFGLLLIIGTCARCRPNTIAFAVAAYISAAYWFTASTSFANPAVTVARALSDSFAGIRPRDVPGFIAAQIVGSGLAVGALQWILPPFEARETG